MFQKILRFLSKKKNVSKDSSFSFFKRIFQRILHFLSKKKRMFQKISSFSFKKYYKSICKFFFGISKYNIICAEAAKVLKFGQGQ